MTIGGGDRDRYGPPPSDADMPGAWPSHSGGGLRENPDMPGTYLGYTRGGATLPQAPASRFPVREGTRYYR